jgi:hypothetical protein
MTAFLQTVARSRWRIAALFDAAFGGMATPGTYVLTRLDGAPTSITITRAWNTDTPAVDLALSGALLDSVIYVLAATGVGTPARVSFIPPLSDSIAVDGEPDDPEGEAFGIDIDWLAPLGPDGDVPQARGVASLLHDLGAVAVMSPGELFHRPDVGADMPQRVNGPNNAAELGGITARLKREWLRDDRVRACTVTTTATTDGSVKATGEISTPALREPVSIAVR